MKPANKVNATDQGPVCPEEDKVALNVRNLPRDLRWDFQALCAQNKIRMQDAVVLLIRDAISRGMIAGVSK